MNTATNSWAFYSLSCSVIPTLYVPSKSLFMCSGALSERPRKCFLYPLAVTAVAATTHKFQVIPWASPWIPATRCSPLVAPWYLMYSRSLWCRLSMVLPSPSDKVPANWHTEWEDVPGCLSVNDHNLYYLLTHRHLSTQHFFLHFKLPDDFVSPLSNSVQDCHSTSLIKSLRAEMYLGSRVGYPVGHVAYETAHVAVLDELRHALSDIIKETHGVS